MYTLRNIHIVFDVYSEGNGGCDVRCTMYSRQTTDPEKSHGYKYVIVFFFRGANDNKITNDSIFHMYPTTSAKTFRLGWTHTHIYNTYTHTSVYVRRRDSDQPDALL